MVLIDTANRSRNLGVASFGFALLFIGVLYSLPGLLSFLNPVLIYLPRSSRLLPGLW